MDEGDLGEFNHGCTNFSLGGQGWKWCLCVGRGVNKRKTEKEGAGERVRQKENLYYFDQEKLKDEKRIGSSHIIHHMMFLYLYVTQ